MFSFFKIILSAINLALLPYFACVSPHSVLHDQAMFTLQHLHNLTPGMKTLMMIRKVQM